MPYNVQKGHVEFVTALFSFPAVPTAALHCHPLVSKLKASVSYGFMSQLDSVAEMLRSEISTRTSITKLRNGWLAVALAWRLGLLRKLSGRGLVCHLGFRVLQNEDIYAEALQGWQGQNLALLKYLKKHSASSLSYHRYFQSRLFFTLLGVLSPQNQRAACGRHHHHSCGWAGQHFTLQTCSSPGEPRLRSKAGGRKMGCATAFYQIPQISVAVWLLLMIILSICIAFSSHRSQNTLKRLVKAIIGSRLSWSTLHPRGQPPLCLAQRASSY